MEKLTEEQVKRAKSIRNAKDRQRYSKDITSKEKTLYRTRKSTARNFLLKFIKEEDKEEFREILKKL